MRQDQVECCIFAYPEKIVLEVETVSFVMPKDQKSKVFIASICSKGITNEQLRLNLGQKNIPVQTSTETFEHPCQLKKGAKEFQSAFGFLYDCILKCGIEYSCRSWSASAIMLEKGLTADLHKEAKKLADVMAALTKPGDAAEIERYVTQLEEETKEETDPKIRDMLYMLVQVTKKIQQTPLTKVVLNNSRMDIVYSQNVSMTITPFVVQLLNGSEVVKNVLIEANNNNNARWLNEIVEGFEMLANFDA